MKKILINQKVGTTESELFWDRMCKNQILWFLSPRQTVWYFWRYISALEKLGLLKIEKDKIYWIDRSKK